MPYRFPLVAVFGNERDGVRDASLEQADHVAVLPVRGITNSLNVAMTASIVLYELLARWEAYSTVVSSTLGTEHQ